MCKQDFGVAADVKSVEALGEFVQEQYQRVLQTGLGMETTVQSLVTVTQHFMASQQHSLSPQVGRCGAWCVEGRSGGWGGGGGEVCVCGGGHGHGDHCTVTSHRHPTLHGLPAAQPLSTGWSVWGLVCGG